MENRYIQIGSIALPDGNGGRYYPPVPIYVLRDESVEQVMEALIETAARVLSLQIGAEEKKKEAGG